MGRILVMQLQAYQIFDQKTFRKMADYVWNVGQGEEDTNILRQIYRK